MTENIYQAPDSDIGNEDHQGPVPASRLRRLGAATVDSLILGLLSFPLMYATGYFDALVLNMRDGVEISQVDTLTASILSTLVWLLLQSYPLIKRQQTLGKMLFGTRIIGMDQEHLPLLRLIGIRYLAFNAIGLVPLIGGFIVMTEVFLIFREDRRTGHDLLAGTRVVMFEPESEYYGDTTTEAM